MLLFVLKGLVEWIMISEVAKTVIHPFSTWWEGSLPSSSWYTPILTEPGGETPCRHIETKPANHHSVTRNEKQGSTGHYSPVSRFQWQLWVSLFIVFSSDGALFLPVTPNDYILCTFNLYQELINKMILYSLIFWDLQLPL